MDTLKRIGQPEILEKIQAVSAEIEYFKTLEVKEITDGENYRIAGDLLARVKMVLKSLEESRTELKAPALSEGKAIDKTYKPIADNLEVVRRKIEVGMWAYAIAENKRKEEAIRKFREEENKRLEAEKQKMLDLAVQQAEQTGAKSETIGIMAMAAAENIETDQQALKNKKINSAVTVLGGNGATTASIEWTFEVVQPLLVPREFCEPVDKLIREAVKGGKREIAGVRIFEKAKFSNR
ncbi:MAG: hypothetical protein WC310_05910 [Patescibacteria group bacterium]|jgi:hypothetical protein